MLDGRPDIILAAYHTRLSRVRDCVPTSETINAIRIKFEFRTEDWNGTEKTAIFARGQNPTKVKDEDIKPVLLDENNECLVPWEVLDKGKYFSAGVFGTAPNYRITSTWMTYRIAPGCCVEGGTCLEPTPTVYDQILEKLQTHNHDDAYYTKYESDAAIEVVQGRIDVLVGEDTNKSIREIATEEANKMVVDANGDIDKLYDITKSNQDAIAVLNGTGEGSVDAAIDQKLNDFATKISDDGTINTFKELIDYAAEHGPEVADIVASVEANEKAIEEMHGYIPKTTSIALLAENWAGDVDIYSQVIQIDDVTEHSKIDLHPNMELLSYLQYEEISLTTVNDNGVITVYALNYKPESDITIDAIITEVM